VFIVIASCDSLIIYFEELTGSTSCEDHASGDTTGAPDAERVRQRLLAR